MDRSVSEMLCAAEFLGHTFPFFIPLILCQRS